MSERPAENGRQRVEPLGPQWRAQGERFAAICDHGNHLWVLHRATEWHARRSLRAHARECPIPPEASEREAGK